VEIMIGFGNKVFKRCMLKLARENLKTTISFVSW